MSFDVSSMSRENGEPTFRRPPLSGDVVDALVQIIGALHFSPSPLLR
jgi:hypothetical protein